jgi:hypothetical protein
MKRRTRLNVGCSAIGKMNNDTDDDDDDDDKSNVWLYGLQRIGGNVDPVSGW